MQSFKAGDIVFPNVQFEIGNLFWDHIDSGLVKAILENDNVICDFFCHNETKIEHVYFKDIQISKSRLTLNEEVFEELKNNHCESDKRLITKIEKLLD